MSTTQKPSVSTRALFLELAALRIPIDGHLSHYDLSKLEDPYAVNLILRARADLDALMGIAASTDPNDAAVRQEGRR